MALPLTPRGGQHLPLPEETGEGKHYTQAAPEEQDDSFKTSLHSGQPAAGRTELRVLCVDLLLVIR